MRVDTRHAGQQTFRVDRARVYDALGLVGLPLQLPTACSIAVEPEPLEPAELPNLSQFQYRSYHPKPGGGFSEIYDLREYRPGDSMHEIHWKLSAKTDKLIVREAEEPNRGLIVLSFDFSGSRAQLDSTLRQLLWLSGWLTDRGSRPPDRLARPRYPRAADKADPRAAGSAGAAPSAAADAPDRRHADDRAAAVSERGLALSHPVGRAGGVRMRPSRYAFPAALLCAAGLSIGLCFCVITSFAVPADPVRLLLACFLAAALFSAVFLLKKSWIWLLVVLLLAGAGGYLLRAELRQSLSALVYAVSSNYADAIPGLQAVSLTEDASGVDATLVLILIAALYALLCSWTVMRGEHLAYLLAGVLPVLVLCLVILQTPPAAWAILLVVGVLALLLLSQLLRARQESEGNRLALLLAVPLALLVGLLAVLFPAKTYEREKWSDSLQQTLADAADKLTLFRRDAQTGQVRFTSPISPSTLGSYLWDSSVTGVNLNRVGPQRQYGRTVMRVQGQTSGLCHLRGDSLAVYEENRWKALSERDYAEAGDAVSAPDGRGGPYRSQ